MHHCWPKLSTLMLLQRTMLRKKQQRENQDVKMKKVKWSHGRCEDFVCLVEEVREREIRGQEDIGVAVPVVGCDAASNAAAGVMVVTTFGEEACKVVVHESNQLQ